ncbi:IS4 family transposase [Shewanella sp. AS16]|uniref:IS4 family transposase n=1 Tax=Shewanella sp. AS16 TaxID=2907625 RepID=UPI001F39FE7B|nr:IS4 family transposase [Shewanella sp. AS16]MCE9685672.1 IS4 family transposase [Shewanella sp. AS16]
MQHISISERLSQLFSENYLNKTAREQGFCRRLRAIQPLPLLTSLVSAMGDASVDSIATLHRTFNGIGMDTTLNVAYKPFHNQLRKQEFAEFVQRVTCRAMALLQTQFQQALPAKLSRFKDILIQDGSSVVLHPELADVYPNRFMLPSPASVKCHMTMSLLSEQPVSLTLTPDRSSERAHLPKAETLTDTLLLADAGYMDLNYFAALARHGGYFLMRGAKHLNPSVIRAIDNKGKVIEKMANKPLKEVLKSSGRKRVLVDLDVAWKQYQCRMVAIWHKEEKRYLCWLTNLPRSRFSIEDISKLYRLRWQVELLFKEWKSHNNLKRFSTRQPHLVEGLIWSSLLSLLVKRYLCRAGAAKAMLRLSMFKMAKTPIGWFEPIMKSLAQQARGQLVADVAWAVKFIAETCKRSPQAKSRKDNSLDEIWRHLNA